MLGSARWRTAACLGIVLLVTAGVTAPAHAIGECPQRRMTGKAPDAFLSRRSPTPPNDAQIRQAERMFRGDGGKADCAACHGVKGNGRGALASQFDPPSRNFACRQNMQDLPDGQLFWIIRFGSAGTAMPAHPKLSDQEIWQLIAYLRRLAG